MIRSLTATMAFLAVPAVAAAPAAQFNLKCSGTTTTQTIAGKETKPYTTIYRVDLAKKKWCEGECKALHDIYAVQPGEITLRYKNTDTFSERSLTSDRIDRETGAHKVTITLANPRDRYSTIILDYEGQCERAVFSGFPSITTKF
ncbi:MAG: hypothetical protein WBA75_04225 [Sphingopyxis granuli]